LLHPAPRSDIANTRNDAHSIDATLAERRFYLGAMRQRDGFTLLEVLIAVVLIDVALLALVAAGSVLVRRTTELRLRTIAARVAADRLELLGVAPCVAASGTATMPQGLRELWTTTSAVNDARDIYDSVTFTVAGVDHSLVLRSRRPC
jgi:Tfp pilus assembly protein PilV